MGPFRRVPGLLPMRCRWPKRLHEAPVGRALGWHLAGCNSRDSTANRRRRRRRRSQRCARSLSASGAGRARARNIRGMRAVCSRGGAWCCARCWTTCRGRATWAANATRGTCLPNCRSWLRRTTAILRGAGTRLTQSTRTLEGTGREPQCKLRTALSARGNNLPLKCMQRHSAYAVLKLFGSSATKKCCCQSSIEGSQETGRLCPLSARVIVACLSTGMNPCFGRIAGTPCVGNFSWPELVDNQLQ